MSGGKNGGGDFAAGANVTVGGLLKGAKISSADTDNGGTVFGIYASNFGKLGIGTWKLGPTDLPFDQGDFWVKQLS